MTTNQLIIKKYSKEARKNTGQMSYYEEIVKQGFFDDENRKDLEDYFINIFHINFKYSVQLSKLFPVAVD